MLYRLRKPEPLHLNDKLTYCHWCTGMLRGLRNIYKGQNCSRHYCSEKCLREGEERAARYAIAGSGFHSRWYVAVAGMLAVLMVAFVSTPRARAQDQAEHHHSPWHDFYKDWKQPNSTSGCCNARYDQNGKEVGDCDATEARLQKDASGALRWFAYFKKENRWIPVPDEKIIREKNPDPTGRDAHFCYNEYTHTPLCFVPPSGTL
jgi:hypothetical protein